MPAIREERLGLTMTEAANYLGLSVSFLRKDMQQGGYEVPRYEIGTRHVYYRDELDKWKAQFRKVSLPDEVTK